MKLTVDLKIAAPLFVYYYVSSPMARNKIVRDSEMTGVPKTNVAYLREFPIFLPPLDQQRAIAHILGTLDDKIELNRRMNETLEAIARAIFQSWFVDFDPVRAKASSEPADSICRRLGLTPDLLALFPDSFQESELGEIPTSWWVTNLGAVSSYLNRGVSPKHVEEGGIMVLNQKCIRDSRVDTTKAKRHNPEQRAVAGRLLQKGDILVNSTGVGTLGRVAQLMNVEEDIIVDSHITVVRADIKKVSWNYLGTDLLQRESEIEALGEGSTGQTELSRIRLSDLSVMVPPRAIIEHFDQRVLPLRKRASTNDVQTRTLAKIRDTLLPKLLSGEVRVRGADSLLAKAT